MLSHLLLVLPEKFGCALHFQRGGLFVAFTQNVFELFDGKLRVPNLSECLGFAVPSSRIQRVPSHTLRLQIQMHSTCTKPQFHASYPVPHILNAMQLVASAQYLKPTLRTFPMEHLVTSLDTVMPTLAL